MPKKNTHRKSRKRSQKALRRRRLKSKKYKSSKWKLEYPEFKEISYFPYIVRKDDKRFR